MPKVKLEASVQVKEEAKETGISERTVNTTKKRGGGSVTYRESKAGEGRGAGRWMWEMPVCELVAAKASVL